jgi:PucR family transcriptional regulator, proline-responsive transcriptional activator
MENDEKVRILCQISRSESLQEAADLAFALLGNPIFVTDSARTVLAYTRCVHIDSPFWQGTIVNANIDRNMIGRASDFLKVHSDSTRANLPVLVTDDRMPEPRIVKTVVANGRVIASVVLTAYLKPFTEEDLDLVELLSSFIKALLARERYIISPNEKSVDNFCIKILDGAKYDEKTICERLALLGYVRKPFYYVLALNAPEEDGSGRDKLLQVLESLRQLPYLRCFSYDLNIVCLYSCDHEIISWSDDAPGLFGLFQRLNLTAGTSQRFSLLSQFRDHFKQAVCALELGILLQRKERFYIYDSLSFYNMVHQLPDHSARLFCHQKILDLAAHDAKHKTNLCQMLQVYLQTMNSQSKTAEIMSVHRNTVHSRIRKCMELLQSDLEDGDEIFTYVLSLRILEHEHMLRQAQEGAAQ